MHMHVREWTVDPEDEAPNCGDRHSCRDRLCSRASSSQYIVQTTTSWVLVVA